MKKNQFNYESKANGFIEKFLDDEFFNTLKEDYGEFTDWYKKAVNDKNKSSFYWTNRGKVTAFLGLKTEDEEIELKGKTLPKEKRIKMTTIKSNTDIPAFSETAFYAAFKTAEDKGIHKVYFTVIPDTAPKKKLKEIAESYGFIDMGEVNIDRKNPEILMEKDLRKRTLEYKSSYPRLILGAPKAARIVPFDAEYHDNYLQDADLKHTIQVRNYRKMGIQKAYVHRQDGILELEQGDIIFPYRKSKTNSWNKSAITGFGTVIKHYRKGRDYNTFEEFQSLVKKYHCFDDEEILSEWFTRAKYLTFYAWTKAFGECKNIPFSKLNCWKILGTTKAYMSSVQLTNEQTKKILKEGGIKYV